MKKVMFLYMELAGYMVECINHLVKHHHTQVKIIAYPVNLEAPFQFKFEDGVDVLSRWELDQNQITEHIQTFSPDLIYVSGWADKTYVNCIKPLQTKTVIGFDNQWFGNPKQQLLALGAKWFLPKWFNYAFVPGQPQVTFAKKLGFKPHQIKEGVYCCDYPLFHEYGESGMVHRKSKWPKKLLWVGRYIEAKGAKAMWEAFIQANEENGEEWELHCAGTGELWDERIEHPSIIHHGFIQPSELKTLTLDSGAFILPSPFEPWGVVVHEFAAAGLPLLLSDQVGAASKFLQNEVNGWNIDLKKEGHMKSRISELMQSSEEKLRKMGEESRKKAATLTPKIWSETILSMS